jgi:hypothetical protein
MLEGRQLPDDDEDGSAEREDCFFIPLLRRRSNDVKE